MRIAAKLFSLAGCTMYMVFLGTPYVIGNISPYLISYFQVQPEQTQLILPTLIFLQTLVMPVGGQLAQKTSPKFLIAVGTFFCLACLLACSMLGRDQFTLFKALYCGGYALAVGMTYMVPIKIGWQLFPQRLGLVSGVVIGGFGLGNILFSKLSTWVVNPDNVHVTQVTLPDGTTKLMFPDSVSLRIPLCFRALFIGLALTICLALVLIQVPSG